MKPTIKPPYLRDGSTGFYNEHNERVVTGSQMGRRDAIPEDAHTVKHLHLHLVPMVDICYDQGGAYWGSGGPLYCAFGESDTEQAYAFFRASNRDSAKRQALALFPKAKFFN